MVKKKFPCEIGYLIGVILMAAGVAFVSASDYGYSMIVAPVYLIFTKLNELGIGSLTFGTVEYLFQGLLLVLMCFAVRRFRVQYLFSFVTAVIYGLTFDGMLALVSLLGIGSLPSRILSYCFGSLLIPLSIAFFVRSYIAPEVYELLVKELSSRYGWEFGKVKLAYDCTCCVFSIVLSILFFGFGSFADFEVGRFARDLISGCVLEGIGIGTLIAALINGPLITLMGKLLDRYFAFTEWEPAARFLK